jgi:hypothetical protein
MLLQIRRFALKNPWNNRHISRSHILILYSVFISYEVNIFGVVTYLLPSPPPPKEKKPAVLVTNLEPQHMQFEHGPSTDHITYMQSYNKLFLGLRQRKEIYINYYYYYYYYCYSKRPDRFWGPPRLIFNGCRGYVHVKYKSDIETAKDCFISLRSSSDYKSPTYSRTLLNCISS